MKIDGTYMIPTREELHKALDSWEGFHVGDECAWNLCERLYTEYGDVLTQWSACTIRRMAEASVENPRAVYEVLARELGKALQVGWFSRQIADEHINAPV